MLRASLKVILLGSMLALAACSDNNNDDDVGGGEPTPPPAAVAIQDQFGTTFSNAFKANANTGEPIEPAGGDLPAVSLTDDPKNL